MDRFSEYKCLCSVIVVLFAVCLVNGDLSVRKLSITMPGVKPTKDNAYLCTSVRLQEKDQYVVKFEPRATQEVAHHMLLFGCSEPGSQKSMWECGDMSSNECFGGEKILFAWAKNAPAKELPKGVAFTIGKSANVNYLVLQVHYKHRGQERMKDKSGFILHTTQHRQPFTAGIFLLWSGNVDIPPETKGIHSDIVCTYNEKTPIYAFAYRTHAHGLGEVITGYKVQGQNWTLLGQGNPQEPQAFYPMNNVVKISSGDIVAARCTYNSKGHHLKTHVRIGSTGQDEMCNFYIMYYRDANMADIRSDECGNQDLDGLIIDFPADYIRPMKNKNTHFKSHKKTMLDHNKGKKSKVHKLHRSYDLVEHWPSLGDQKLGQVSGIALDSSGHLLLFHRGSREWDGNSFDEHYVFTDPTPIEEFTVLTLNASSGEVVGKWGKNMFFLPHGITVDHDDNIWLADVAMHQVLKYPPNGGGKPLLSLGEKFVPGSDENHFCQPTDVAVEKGGVFYVADGYCNSRIMKFSATGRVLAQWGGPSGQAIGSFAVPHSLSLDESNHRLYIADRENGRVQSLDTLTGQFAQPITKEQFGLIFAVDFNSQNEVLHVLNGNSVDTSVPVKGLTLRLKDNMLLESWPKRDTHYFSHPHDVVSSSDGRSIFVAEINPNKVWKLTKHSRSTPDRETTRQEGNKLTTHKHKETDSTGVVQILRCTYAKDTGPCRAAIPRWYYNERTRHCMHFTYGGCQGNVNNFKSKEECQTNCDSDFSFQNKSEMKGFGHSTSKKVLEILSSKKENSKDEANENKTNSQENILRPTSNNGSNKEQYNISISPLHTAAKHLPDQENTEGLQPGMIPALIILSVLAVPIVFLLLISIVLRVRAYRREARYNSGRLFKSEQEGLAIGRTRGWWSYLNCCDKRKYGFDKVNLAEFYSDSESDGV